MSSSPYAALCLLRTQEHCAQILALRLCYVQALRFLVEFLQANHNVVALTGAGVSTESSIPDYRGPRGAYSTGFKPMTHQQVLLLRSSPRTSSANSVRITSLWGHVVYSLDPLIDRYCFNQRLPGSSDDRRLRCAVHGVRGVASAVLGAQLCGFRRVQPRAAQRGSRVAGAAAAPGLDQLAPHPERGQVRLLLSPRHLTSNVATILSGL